MAPSFSVRNASRGLDLAAQVWRADRFGSRLRGLLGRSALPAGEGLWLDPCNSVHTFFMRFPIDVLFLDGDLRVVRVITRLPPWRATRVHGAAQSCLELAAGSASGTSTGDRLQFRPAGGATA